MNQPATRKHTERLGRNMIQWILVLTVHITTPEPVMPDVDVNYVPGFRTSEACERAAKTMAYQTISQIGKHREQQGLKSNRRLGAPSINTDCVRIEM